MPIRTTYAVRVFERSGARLASGKRVAAATMVSACHMAQALAAKHVGAVALRIVTDDEGRHPTATVVGKFGEIPDNFVEGMLDI